MNILDRSADRAVAVSLQNDIAAMRAEREQIARRLRRARAARNLFGFGLVLVTAAVAAVVGGVR